MKNKISFIIALAVIFTFQAHPLFAKEKPEKKPKAKQEKVDKTEKNKDIIDIQDDEISKIIVSGIEENRFMSLEDCLKIAIANNPTVKAAISNTEIYKSRIGQAKASYFPRFNISNGFSYNNTPVQKSIADDNVNSFDIVNIGISQLLFDFGKTTTNIDIQKTGYKATEEDLKTVINNLVYDVKQAYYWLLLASHRQDVLEESVDQYEQLLEQAKAFYAVGTKPKIDTLTAEVNLSNAKLDLIKAKNAVSVAFATLNNTMGLPESPIYRLKNKLTYIDKEFAFDELIKTAYENRPDYKAAELRVEAAQKHVKLAKKDYYPTIGGVSGFSLRAFDASGNSSIDEGWNAGLALDLPVLNYYMTRKKIDEAKASEEKEVSTAQSMKNTLYFQVKQTYMNFIEAQNSVPAAEIALKQAEESFNLAKGRYKVGVGDPIEVKDAELTHRNAQFAYYRALYDYNVAVAKLENVTGIGVNF